MPSSNQFTALGPAIVGFQTDGANIQRGAEAAGTQVGVHGIGPIGVHGEGQAGSSGGSATGVRGEGQGGGPGGSFAAQPGSGTDSSGAQVHLDPQAIFIPGGTMEVTPSQYAKPGPILPSYGTVGDLWLAQDTGAQQGAALWICVQASAGTFPQQHPIQPAVWRQVLLGTPVQGPQPTGSL
jgi:hypothetical protein